MIESMARGAMSGSIALLIALLVADTTAHLGVPAFWTGILGIWAFLIVVAVLFPPEPKP